MSLMQLRTAHVTTGCITTPTQPFNDTKDNDCDGTVDEFVFTGSSCGSWVSSRCDAVEGPGTYGCTGNPLGNGGKIAGGVDSADECKIACEKANAGCCIYMGGDDNCYGYTGDISTVCTPCFFSCRYDPLIECNPNTVTWYD